MIIGSIYLTKKAKKAFRKRQAEAQRLTEAVSVEDPSSELTLKVPPSSRTGSQISLISLPDTESPSSVFSIGHARASRSSSDLRSPSSQYSSYSNTTSGVKEFEQFVRRQSNDYLHHASEQPPSYETVVSTSCSAQAQRASPLTSEPPFAVSTSSAHPSWSTHHSLHSNCPACSAIMQQHQQHEHSRHHSMRAHSHHQHHPESSAFTYPQIRPTIPTIPEMPDPSVYRRFQIAGPPRTISEAPDTGIYESEASKQAPEATTAVELPAEVPTGFSDLSVVDTDEKHKNQTRLAD